MTIFHGDCRDVMPQIERVDCIITDPVWPNAIQKLVGAENPFCVLATAAVIFPRLSARAVIVLGCNSDPRFLSAIPASLPFFRICWLEYARPSYRGRLLYTSDIAYVFGVPPASREGRRVMSGYCQDTSSDGRQTDHPTPRKLGHMKWLVGKWADGTVLDPFAGSGTTLRAAKDLGYPSIGIEIEERWCEVAAKRMAQGVMPMGIPSDSYLQEVMLPFTAMNTSRA